jgi:two-component system, sensor histidine kinase and response regulator
MPVTNNLKNCKILIVDDTPTNIMVLRGILEEQGINIAIAKNGKQALTYAPKFEPDLILLDIMMPEMDGFEACEKLKLDDSTKDIPIVFLTAKVENEDITKGLELGAVDYILKPFHHEEVLSRIKTHIGLRKTVLKNEQLIRELKDTVILLNEEQRDNIAKSEFISRIVSRQLNVDHMS